MSDFWLPVMATSTPQASIWNGSAPMLVMPSTISSVSSPPTSRTTLATFSRSATVAVLVSLWTSTTASTWPFRSSAAISSGVTCCPYGSLISVSGQL